jgi:hypothetical protein
MKATMSYLDLIERLNWYVDAAGSQHKAAKQLGISVAHLNGILKHRDENKIGPMVLKALGCVEVVAARRYRETT